MAAGVTYYGYPVPDCTASEEDCTRYRCADLAEMDSIALMSERSMLLWAIGAGRYSGGDAPLVNSPDGYPIPFARWASERVSLIGKRLRRGGAAGGRP